MRIRLPLALLSLAGLSAAALGYAPAPSYKEPPRSRGSEVAAAIEGTWEMESRVINARLARGAAVRGGAVMQRTTRVRIQGGTWTYVYLTNGVEREGIKYAYEIDAKQNPAAFDLKYVNPNVALVALPGGGFVPQAVRLAMKGIVKVEGDTLTFAYVTGNTATAARPRDFTPANPGQFNGMPTRMMTLKRVK